MSRRDTEPPPDSRREVLFDSLGVAALAFHCRAGVGPEGPEEPNATHSIVFVRRGVFRRTSGRESLVVDANHVLFFNAGEPHRYAHPLAGGDDCTVLTLETARALELVARHEPRDAERGAAPFRMAHALVSPRVARLHLEILALLGRGAAALTLEDALAELADEALRAAYATGRPQAAGARSAAGARRRRDLAEAAKLALAERPESPPSLGALARRLGCSPFHLSRSFHRAVGVSLRAYLGRLRAALAAERLRLGEPDLTTLALELGYCDHSHFTNAFRGAWGVPPSRLRALLRAG